jgi:hypothetical protein
MTNVTKKIGIIVAVLLIVLVAGVLIVTFLVPKSSSSISFRGDYFKSTRPDLHIGLTKKINEEYSLTVEDVYLGTKQILITYTFKSKTGMVPSDDMYHRICDNCKISIDGNIYDRIEGGVLDISKMMGSLDLQACYYGTDFALTENSNFKITFSNLIEDINFEFSLTEKPDFLKDQIDYAFRYNLKKYNIQSMELDSTATTLNFSKLYYNESPDLDIRLVQNGKEYYWFTFCSDMYENHYYISFQPVEKGIPFDIYVEDEKIYTHTFY